MATETATFEAAASSIHYGYHRFDSWRLDGSVDSNDDVVCRIYHYDSASPSGKILAASLNDRVKAKEILIRAGRI